MWFVNIVFWLQAFLCPFLISGIVGFAITKNISVVALIIGGVLGVILAEYIRRKIGLDVFFARIYGPNSMDEKFNKKKE